MAFALWFWVLWLWPLGRLGEDSCSSHREAKGRAPRSPSVHASEDLGTSHEGPPLKGPQALLRVSLWRSGLCPGPLGSLNIPTTAHLHRDSRGLGPPPLEAQGQSQRASLAPVVPTSPRTCLPGVCLSRTFTTNGPHLPPPRT